jgi:hypothetical protein
MVRIHLPPAESRANFQPRSAAKGLSAEEKATRSAALRGQLRQLEAKQELQWWQVENAGQTPDRTGCSAEMFLRVTDDLLSTVQP